MLRTVFLGSPSRFDQALVHWLAQRTDLRGVVWTTSTQWRATWRGRLRFAATRVRRRGPLRAADEAAFHLYYHRRHLRRDHDDLVRDVLAPYEAEHGRPRWTGPAIETDDVNEPEVVEFVRSLEPDLALAMCVNDFFGTAIREAPRLGTFLWHEGVTPAYKGLYAPFWAAQNGEQPGWTVLRMNDRLDGGDAYAQGVVEDVRRTTGHGHLYTGHLAIWDSLPAVEDLLRRLEDGTAEPIATSGEPRSYTYPGLSDLARKKARTWWWRRQGLIGPRTITPAGAARECPICGTTTRAFLPHGADGRRRSDVRCPACGSLERHRLVWLFLQRETDLLDAAGPRRRVLHLAPELPVAHRLAGMRHLEHLTADLESPLADEHWDLTAIPHGDASFDVVLCNHVLEHVADDRRAMRELARVLRPHGFAILQVPVLRDETTEDGSVTDPAERERRFGHPEHVRAYGPDYADRLGESGFEVAVIPYAQRLGTEAIERFALDPREDVYLCRRG